MEAYLMDRIEIRNGNIYDTKENEIIISESEFREKYRNILNQLRNNNFVSIISLIGSKNIPTWRYIKKDGYWHNLDNKSFNDTILDEDLAQFALEHEVFFGYEVIMSNEKDLSKYDTYYERRHSDENKDEGVKYKGELFDLSRQKSPQDLKGKRIRHTKKPCKKQPMVRVNFRKMI